MLARTCLNVMLYVHCLYYYCYTGIVHWANVDVTREQASQHDRLHSERLGIFGGLAEVVKNCKY